jgi:ribosome-binding factor A
MNRRIERINSLLRDIAAWFVAAKLGIGGVIVTVTKVEVGRDLKHAKIFISVFPENKNIFILRELNKNKKTEFYDYLAPRFKAKFMPICEFKIDKGEENARRIEGLLEVKN